MAALQKRDINVSKVFLAFMALQGDYKRTAMACGLPEEDVVALAAQENWAAQLADAAALREQDPNIQITINRACSYIQSCQLSNIIDAVIKEMSDPERMMDMLTTMDQREATVLRMRFGLDSHDPRTLKEIGEQLGLTRERVRQIETEALNKMAESMEDPRERMMGDLDA